MSGEEGGFLSRWAQRKQRSRAAAVTEPEAPRGPVPAPAPDPEAAGTAVQPVAAEPGALSEEEVAALPDPDSLQAGDDFKPFLQRGVPEILKRRALRRLWAINPLFNVRDGLNDYDEDYTDAATVVANLQTLFQPGKGMPQPERWRKPVPPAPEVGPEDGPEVEAGEPAEGQGETADSAGAPGSDESEAAPAAKAASGDPAALEGPSAEPPAGTAAEGGRPRKGSAAQRRWGGFASADPEAPTAAGAITEK